jgi:uncharacterized protein
VRYPLWLIVLGLPLAGIGCAGPLDGQTAAEIEPPNVFTDADRPAPDAAPSSTVAFRTPPASAPSSTVTIPAPPARPKGLLQSLLGSSPSSASPSPAAPSSSAGRAERQRLHEKLLFHPTQHPDGIWQPKDLRPEDVSFAASDGTRLHGWYVASPTPQGVLLYAHGNGGNLSYDSRMIRRLRDELHLSVFAFDYRGYGRSEGKPTVTGVLDDARSARAWLARRAEIPEGQVILMGRSLGGAVVIQLAGELPPRGLVVESSFASLREVADHHFSKLSWLVPRDELNSAATLARYQGPLLVSHGDADRTIPPAHGQKLFEAAGGQKQFFNIAGGDHNDPQPDDYYRRLNRFLDELP